MVGTTRRKTRGGFVEDEVAMDSSPPSPTRRSGRRKFSRDDMTHFESSTVSGYESDVTPIKFGRRRRTLSDPVHFHTTTEEEFRAIEKQAKSPGLDVIDEAGPTPPKPKTTEEEFQAIEAAAKAAKRKNKERAYSLDDKKMEETKGSNKGESRGRPRSRNRSRSPTRVSASKTAESKTILRSRTRSSDPIDSNTPNTTEEEFQAIEAAAKALKRNKRKEKNSAASLDKKKSQERNNEDDDIPGINDTPPDHGDTVKTRSCENKKAKEKTNGAMAKAKSSKKEEPRARSQSPNRSRSPTRASRETRARSLSPNQSKNSTRVAPLKSPPSSRTRSAAPQVPVDKESNAPATTEEEFRAIEAAAKKAKEKKQKEKDSASALDSQKAEVLPARNGGKRKPKPKDGEGGIPSINNDPPGTGDVGGSKSPRANRKAKEATNGATLKARSTSTEETRGRPTSRTRSKSPIRASTSKSPPRSRTRSSAQPDPIEPSKQAEIKEEPFKETTEESATTEEKSLKKTQTKRSRSKSPLKSTSLTPQKPAESPATPRGLSSKKKSPKKSETQGEKREALTEEQATTKENSPKKAQPKRSRSKSPLKSMILTPQKSTESPATPRGSSPKKKSPMKSETQVDKSEALGKTPTSNTAKKHMASPSIDALDKNSKEQKGSGSKRKQQKSLISPAQEENGKAKKKQRIGSAAPSVETSKNSAISAVEKTEKKEGKPSSAAAPSQKSKETELPKEDNFLKAKTKLVAKPKNKVQLMQTSGKKKKTKAPKNELTGFIPGYTAKLQLESNLKNQRPGLDGLRKRALVTDKTTAGFVKGSVANQKQTKEILAASSTKVSAAFKQGSKPQASLDAGEKWFGMAPTPLTEDVKRDLHVIRNRGYLDPKRFYKSSDKETKFVQVGTVIEGNAEFYSSRLTKKQRRSNLTEEMMADTATADYAKRKYRAMQQEKHDQFQKRRQKKKRSRKAHA